jgi:hypothetical protein
MAKEKQFTRKDAEAAGYTFTHEGVEDGSLNAQGFRAEKYVNEPGRAGVFVEEYGDTEEALLRAIQFREQRFSVSEEGDVLLPVEGKEADTSDPSTFERVPDETLSLAKQNDSLTVLADPSDPESAHEQRVIVGGTEVAPEDEEQ